MLFCVNMEVALYNLSIVNNISKHNSATIHVQLLLSNSCTCIPCIQLNEYFSVSFYEIGSDQSTRN